MWCVSSILLMLAHQAGVAGVIKGGAQQVAQSEGSTLNYPWRTHKCAPEVIQGGPRQMAPVVGPGKYPWCTHKWCARGICLDPPLEPATRPHPNLLLEHQNLVRQW
jgi:hypothetical protein